MSQVRPETRKMKQRKRRAQHKHRHPGQHKKAATRRLPSESVRASTLTADLALPIEELVFTARTYNLLKRLGINSVGELTGRTPAELRNARQAIGDKTINEIWQKLARMGLGLRGGKPAPNRAG